MGAGQRIALLKVNKGGYRGSTTVPCDDMPAVKRPFPTAPFNWLGFASVLLSAEDLKVRLVLLHVTSGEREISAEQTLGLVWNLP